MRDRLIELFEEFVGGENLEKKTDLELIVPLLVEAFARLEAQENHSHRIR